MGVIDKIENKALKYVELGYSYPNFVFLSSDLYSELKKCLTAKSDVMGLVIYTSVGALRVKICNSLPNDTIIIEKDNPLLIVLQKLRVI